VPRRDDTAAREAQVRSLREALAALPEGRFEAWVTHQFVLQDLAGRSSQPAEALVLRARASAGAGGRHRDGDAVEVLATAQLS